MQLLASHAGGSAGSQDGHQPFLSARKVALKGLGGVATPDSAQAIRAIAEDSSVHLYLRQMAVEMYSGHPHGNGDISHLVATRCDPVVVGIKGMGCGAVRTQRGRGSESLCLCTHICMCMCA